MNGSQGVLISWTPIAGQVTTTICHGTSASNINCLAVGSGYQVSGSSYVDGPTVFPSGTLPQTSLAVASALSSAGLSATTLTMPGGGFKGTMSGNFTANRTQLLPDVSGTLVASSYLNSAYDNATRANGAIGSNWSLNVNSLNISGNAFVGKHRRGAQYRHLVRLPFLCLRPVRATHRLHAERHQRLHRAGGDVQRHFRLHLHRGIPPTFSSRNSAALRGLTSRARALPAPLATCCALKLPNPAAP